MLRGQECSATFSGAFFSCLKSFRSLISQGNERQSTKLMESSELLWSQITRLYQTEREACLEGSEHTFQT